MTTKIDSIKKQLIHDITHSKFCDAWFYEEHLLVVEKLAMALCEYYPKANREAVNLMVWFHDIGRAHNANRDHDLYGAEYAQKILTANSFTQTDIDLIVEACKTHSCDDYGKPKSLEGKILATADAMSHFHHGFYLRILNSWSQKVDPDHYKELARNTDYQFLKQKLLEKIDKDYQEKIFFKEAKQAILPMYQAWKKIVEAVQI